MSHDHAAKGQGLRQKGLVCHMTCTLVGTWCVVEGDMNVYGHMVCGGGGHECLWAHGVWYMVCGGGGQ